MFLHNSQEDKQGNLTVYYKNIHYQSKTHIFGSPALTCIRYLGSVDKDCIQIGENIESDN